jgi:hypothetical protein
LVIFELKTQKKKENLTRILSQKLTVMDTREGEVRVLQVQDLKDYTPHPIPSPESGKLFYFLGLKFFKFKVNRWGPEEIYW